VIVQAFETAVDGGTPFGIGAGGDDAARLVEEEGPRPGLDGGAAVDLDVGAFGDDGLERVRRRPPVDTDAALPDQRPRLGARGEAELREGPFESDLTGFQGLGQESRASVSWMGWKGSPSGLA
jgi:hypothetical protein